MNFIADFHIHSHYSLATSKQLTPQHLDYWAKMKGVNVVGTGDFTHPKWTTELRESFIEAEQGLFRLKDDLILPNNPHNDNLMRFLLTAEISNIYKKGGKVRKIHNIVVAPDFQTVEKVQKKLIDKKFNITSDGRPILGLDSRDLLEILLEINDEIMLIPAHIWTPWFAALGSKSGFDTIEECYGDLSGYIHAVEMGLSADQPLNWLCSFLDKYTLLSNSDAHSPEKLGRNANLFNTELSYNSILNALKNQDSNDFVGTIDMYPQEGKYHFDGHRKCNVCYSPTETMQHKGICPVCGSGLTLGVAHRIAQLADRDNPEERPIKKEFKYVIPLKEIIAEIQGVSAGSKGVDNIYHQLINELGSEFDILLNLQTDEIKHKGGEFLSVAIDRMRQGNVILKEGYDGEYGVVKLFENNEIRSYGSKKSLFDIEGEIQKPTFKERKLLNFDVAAFRILKNDVNLENISKLEVKSNENTEQKQAIEFDNGNTLILAGPGTGKTRVLTERIKFLIEQKNAEPEKIWAVTFSNQAANELQKRILNLIDKESAEKIRISTFHAFGFDFLKNQTEKEPVIINDSEKEFILKKLEVQHKQVKSYINKISLYKNSLEKEAGEEFLNIFKKYNKYLSDYNLLDFDDLIYLINNKLEENPTLTENFNFEHILIDEFQDINKAQYELITKISTNNTTIFAIGDPNQSIYGFRGSDVKLINEYIENFKATTLSLSQSYRCSNSIINASQDIVKSQHKLTGISKGVRISISEQPTDKSEAENIARTIEDMIGGLRFFSMDSKITQGNEIKDIESLSDFAILVRTKQQFEVLEKALNDHSIPYQVVGTKSFLTEKPFTEITAVLKSVAYPENNFFEQKVLQITSTKPNFDSNLKADEIILHIWDKYFSKKEQPKQFDKYLELAKTKSLVQFLTEIEQKIGQDDYNSQIESVNIMTLHASKGLEFKCVFIPGLEDGVLPYTIFRPDADIEEERRLLYVGMTRAQKYLYLSYAKGRTLGNLRHNFVRSRFIEDIKKELLQYKKQKLKSKPNDTQMDLFG